MVDSPITRYFLALSLILSSRGALAAEPPPAVDTRVAAHTATASPSGLSLDDRQTWSVALEAYGGLGVLTTSDTSEGHAFAGGISRFRLSYFQIGGYVEATSHVSYTSRALGGVLGVWLPFQYEGGGPRGTVAKWVDLDVAAGFGRRSYSTTDQRYGPGGYDVSTPVASLRIGVSDRAASGTLAPRLGGQLVASLDLSPKDEPWFLERELSDGSMVSDSGSTKVGGLAIGIAITIGLDVNPRY